MFLERDRQVPTFPKVPSISIESQEDLLEKTVDVPKKEEGQDPMFQQLKETANESEHAQ